MEAVIFDLDGVLVDSSSAHQRAWHRIGEEVGVPFGPDLFRRTFGMHNAQIIPLWLGRELEPSRLSRLAERKEELYQQEIRQHLAPLEGASELVRALEASGFRLAVGSSAPRANVDLVLDGLGLTSRFQVLSTGDDVTHGKPHPEVFLVAARRLAVSPDHCVVVEDAPQGVEAGLAGGFAVLAVTSSRPAADLVKAHRVVRSLAEVGPGDIRELIDRVATSHAVRPRVGQD